MKKTFIRTKNVKQFVSLMDELQKVPPNIPKMALVYGEHGLGKSQTIQWWADKNDSVYVRATQGMTSRWLLLGLNIALVTGTGNASTYGSDKFDTILENFAPKSKLQDYTRNSKNQIDILICTDCISEGQNLQDCDTVVNYDIHWNPVRLIQRFGRIDRIGSDNAEIQMISFWPTQDLEHYIKLQYRVEARMALADQTTTTDDYILEEQDLEFSQSNELSFREKQIQKLMAEEPLDDIEDSSEDLALTDFSMEDFHADLAFMSLQLKTKLMLPHH